MRIEKNAVVGIEYTLTGEDGQVIDSSREREPLYYIQGLGQIIPGLETALEGRSHGEELRVKVPPEAGYGEHRRELIREVPKERFPDDADLEIGNQFRASSEQGPIVVTVTQVAEEVVTVDANHPLAGETLNFEVEIVEVREASTEELDHGHVHGQDGHDHA